MRILIAMSLAVLLSGCGRMSYEEVQAQSKYCTDNGMKVTVVKDVRDAAALVRCIDSDGTRYVPKGAE